MKHTSIYLRITLAFLLFLLECHLGVSRPLLSFFTESEAKDLQTLLSRPGIKETLKDMRAELRVGLSEFTPEHAAAIQILNEAGIPVYAWLKANESQGQTFRIDNASSILKRYKNFKSWSDTHDLRWSGLGIDLRPRPENMQDWVEQPILSAWNSYLNLFNQEELDLAFDFYSEFLREARADGFLVESYILPYAMDEMEDQTQGFQYLSQIVNLQTDRIIPLCYSSFPYFQPAGILEYGKRSGRVGIGSTSNKLLSGQLQTEALDWEDLSRDLRLAHDVCQEIHLANLESIVANGWLESVAEFDFSVPVFLYSKEINEQATQTYLSQKASQALSYPLLTSIVLLILAILSIILCYIFLRYLFRWKKRNEISPQEEIDYEIISG